MPTVVPDAPRRPRATVGRVEPTVLPVASRALADACGRLGLDVGGLLARAGIERSALLDPDARLPASRADALWREAYAAANDPFLALRAAEASPFGAFRVMDYLGTTGPTLGEGLRRVAACFRVIDPRGSLGVSETAGRVTILFRTAAGTPLPPPAQEYTLAVLLIRARHAIGAPLRPAEVRFTFPRPPDVSEHVRAFGVEPVFASEDAALVLPRTAWDEPTRGGDPALFAMLDEHARRLADARAVGDVGATVRAAIAASLAGRQPALSEVAHRLGTPARTLQRRLAAAGTSFARLVGEVRRDRAEAFLAERDVSIAEVSFLLGFSEQSAFARAFRRWTGRTPSEHRRGS